MPTPFDLIRRGEVPPPTIRRSGDNPGRTFPDVNQGGLPAVPLPVPGPPLTVPPVPPVRIPFPTGPAANDPVFSRAGTLIRGGNILVGAAILIDIIVRKAQDLTIEREERDREATLRAAMRIHRRENPNRQPREIVFPAEIPGPRSPNRPEFPQPDLEPSPSLPSQRPGISPIELPGIEIPAQVPAPLPPGQPVIPAPVTPSPANFPTPMPVGTPGIGTNPGVFTPTPSPTPFPGAFPTPFPISFPRAVPVGDPFLQPIGDFLPDQPLTGVDPGGVGSTFADVLDLPQPQPQPQTQRRCKPCKEDEAPEPRNKCFKGLYREGRMKDDVSFTEWAEINCETGEEL